MTFGFIEVEKASFPISRMCDVLGVSQSGFFVWQDRQACRRQQQDMVYLAHIRTAFALSNGTYGSPRRRTSRPPQRSRCCGCRWTRAGLSSMPLMIWR